MTATLPIGLTDPAGPGAAPAPALLTLPALAAPDADYETLRARALAVVTALAGRTWTDHNAADPGSTLLEALAYGVADVHYRTAARGLDGWPLAAPTWRADGARGWAPGGLTDDVAPTVVLAHALATAPAGGSGLSGASLAEALAPVVDATDGPEAAVSAVVDAAAGAGVPLTGDVARRAVALLRRPRLLRGALDLSGAVADALTEARGLLGPAAARAAVDAKAVELLRYDARAVPLWDVEVLALLERQRRREAGAALVAATPRILAATTAAEVAVVLADLTAAMGAVLSTAGPAAAAAAHQGLALHPGPPPGAWGSKGGAPEEWEDPAGGTAVWPPTPDQALRTEPVTGEDYAQRARAVPGVARAWALAGALAGTAWHGGPTVPGDRPGAVTLLVERADPPPPAHAGETEAAFARRVLVAAIGEAADPYDLYRRTSPRRLLGDEVGIAVLRRVPVLVQGTLHAAVGADRTALVAACRARIAAYLDAGRPESRAGAAPSAGPAPSSSAVPSSSAAEWATPGPWPDAPQPLGGWEPGEAIPISELVEVMAADPAVLGVSGVQAAVDGGPLQPAVAGAIGDVHVPTGTVPRLASRDCLRVVLALGAECGDA